MASRTKIPQASIPRLSANQLNQEKSTVKGKSFSQHQKRRASCPEEERPPSTFAANLPPRSNSMDASRRNSEPLNNNNNAEEDAIAEVEICSTDILALHEPEVDRNVYKYLANCDPLSKQEPLEDLVEVVDYIEEENSAEFADENSVTFADDNHRENIRSEQAWLSFDEDDFLPGKELCRSSSVASKSVRFKDISQTLLNLAAKSDSKVRKRPIIRKLNSFHKRKLANQGEPSESSIARNNSSLILLHPGHKKKIGEKEVVDIWSMASEPMSRSVTTFQPKLKGERPSRTASVSTQCYVTNYDDNSVQSKIETARSIAQFLRRSHVTDDIHVYAMSEKGKAEKHDDILFYPSSINPISKLVCYDMCSVNLRTGEAQRFSEDTTLDGIGFASIYIAPYVYVIGGSAPTVLGVSKIEPRKVVWRLNTGNGVWRQVASLFEGRYMAAVAEWGGQIYVFGGVGDLGKALNTVEMLDTNVGKGEMDICHLKGWKVVLKGKYLNANVQEWTYVAPMKKPRFGAAACATNSKIYVAGMVILEFLRVNP